MDIMDIHEAYDLAERAKAYIKSLNKGFEIVKEESDAGRIVLTFESKNGEDGLPTVIANGSKKKGTYFLSFDCRGEINFIYRPAGWNCGSLCNSLVDVNENGKPRFKSLANMMELMKIQDKWNDDCDAQNRMSWLEMFAEELPDCHHYLFFQLGTLWDLVEEPIDNFLREFPIALNTVLSDDAKNLFERLSKFMVPGEKL
jgi:hypothetical protein